MPWYPASVTKMMTAYVTLKAVKEGRISLDTLLTVSPVAASQSPSKMGFKPGTQVTVDNALKMMLVKSANDMAVVLAEGVGGSIDGFSAQMNEAAQRLGMTQTSYVNPNGLPADGQITSARDLAILARAIIRDLPEYEYFVHIPSIRFGRKVTQNFNKLIGRYPGADGFKTGFICASGYNLVASATRNGKRLIAVVLGASSGTMRAVRAAQLLDRGFAGNTLSWLRPSLGTVDNLVPIDASPPNLRDEMCGAQAQAAGQRRGRGHHRRQCRRFQQRRNRRDVLCRRAAAADDEAFGTDGGARRGVRADPGLYRPDPNRRRVDCRGRRGHRTADVAAARKEVARVAAKKPDAAAEPKPKPRMPARTPTAKDPPSQAEPSPSNMPMPSRMPRQNPPTSQARRQACRQAGQAEDGRKACAKPAPKRPAATPSPRANTARPAA